MQQPASSNVATLGAVLTGYDTAGAGAALAQPPDPVRESAFTVAAGAALAQDGTADVPGELVDSLDDVSGRGERQSAKPPAPRAPTDSSRPSNSRLRVPQSRQRVTPIRFHRTRIQRATQTHANCRTKSRS